MNFSSILSWRALSTGSDARRLELSSLDDGEVRLRGSEARRLGFVSECGRFFLVDVVLEFVGDKFLDVAGFNGERGVEECNSLRGVSVDFRDVVVMLEGVIGLEVIDVNGAKGDDVSFVSRGVDVGRHDIEETSIGIDADLVVIGFVVVHNSIASFEEGIFGRVDNIDGGISSVDVEKDDGIWALIGFKSLSSVEDDGVGNSIRFKGGDLGRKIICSNES